MLLYSQYMNFPIDYWLLQRIQSLSVFLQGWIGGDNFVYARVLFRVELVLIAIRVFLQEGLTPVGTAIRLLTYYLVVGFVGLIGWYGEKMCQSSPGCKNPNERAFATLRLLSLAAITLSTVILYLLILALAAGESVSLRFSVAAFFEDVNWFMYLYFASCTPLPPKPKERKALENVAFQGA